MTTLDAAPRYKSRAETRRERKTFQRVRNAEREYATRLRQIAWHVGQIVQGFEIGEPGGLAALREALYHYSSVIGPWARAVASRMLTDVSRRDEQVWAELAKSMNRALRAEIRTAPTGEVLRTLLHEQVTLIKSLPLKAAERVHLLTLQGLEDSTRASEIAKEIRRSGQVTASRANLIARTEVARTASGLMQARAEHVGSEGYIWRTALDSDVRRDHRILEGTFHRWDDPPIADRRANRRAHPGMIYNCRCYPEPVLPDQFVIH